MNAVKRTPRFDAGPVAGAIAVMGLVALIASLAPLAAAEPGAAQPQAPALFLSRVDQVMISAQEFSEWMARRKSRLELRDANHAIEQMCDRLQDAERRMSTIATDPSLRPEDAQRAEIRRFGEQVAAVARELETLHASVRRLAEAVPASGDSLVDADRERHAIRQAELIAELDRADKHSREIHAWVIDKPAPRGLDEMSRDLDLARDEVRGIILAMGRLASDPAATRQGLRELSQVQDCARVLVQALGDAQDRIATLAGGK